ncbi:MAG TPA: DNA internalization-related competence protein ComEC/Rec2 [Polyangiaceae bacterium]|jgi:competence protein ComEC
MRRGPDFIDASVVVGAGLLAGGVLPFAPWQVVFTVACAFGLAALRRRVGLGLAVVAMASLGVGAVRVGRAVARQESGRARADLVLPAASRCAGSARVLSSPVEVRGGLRWDAELRRVSCAEGSAHWDGVATLYGGPGDLARGDEVEVVATLAPPQLFWNAATGDPRPSAARRGVLRSGGALDVRVTQRGTGVWAWIDRVRAHIRGRIDATFDPALSPMARALVLGESDLAPDDDLAFRASGLSHLLAVSGMHLVLVAAMTLRALEVLLARIEAVAARLDVGRIVAFVGIPAAWLYSDLAGAGGSTVRAAWMMTVALTARALGRRADGVRAFGLSMAVMAVVDPLVAFDLSFALSAGATAGLLAFARPFDVWLRARAPKAAAVVVGPVATTLAASLPCAPILARFAPTLPIGGVVANLLAVPVGESAALPLCLVHAAVSRWPTAERGSAVVASGALVLVRWIARFFAAPWLTVQVPQPTSWQLAVLAVGIVGAVLRAARGATSGSTGGRIEARAFTAAIAAALLLLEWAQRRSGAPQGVLRASFLDVGQGDSALVDLPDGEAMLVDGGGLVGSPLDVGTRVVAPELRARRRRDLALVVLSHPHPDHFSGLATGLDAVHIGVVWDTGQGEAEHVGGAYAAFLAAVRARGVPVLHPPELCGSHAIGGARVDVVGPCPDFSSDRGPNDNSLVLRVTYGRRSMLFVGDAEREEETWMLARGAMLRADVLKVGHHGSRTSSSPAFLDAVSPLAAVISVGSRNRFGHPSAITLAGLAARGTRVWRTDRDGAVTVTTDGTSLDVAALASE